MFNQKSYRVTFEHNGADKTTGKGSTWVDAISHDDAMRQVRIIGFYDPIFAQLRANSGRLGKPRFSIYR